MILVGEAKVVFSKCDNISDDLGKFNDFFFQFAQQPIETVKRVTYNYIHHGGEINADVTEAMACWDRGESFEWGVHFADAIVLAVSPIPSTATYIQ